MKNMVWVKSYLTWWGTILPLMNVLQNWQVYQIVQVLKWISLYIISQESNIIKLNYDYLLMKAKKNLK